MTGSLAEVGQLFARFDSDAGSDAAARSRFQTLVTDLVKAKFPDATTVEGAGNRDWGIDTVQGTLAGGTVRIWQSKYVLTWQTKDPQGQVRASFRSAISHAQEQGYQIDGWTLVVPCILAPDQLKWFHGWAKRESAKNGLAIDMWDGAELRHQLMTQDAVHVRAEYFHHTIRYGEVSADTQLSQEIVATIADYSAFSSALFVRQLHEAGCVETDSACAHFFATDALMRDYEAKSSDRALSSMAELHLEVQDIWERRYNGYLRSADDKGRMPGLLDTVIEDAAKCANPTGLYLARAHRKGTVHRLVEQKKAGWVTYWREVAGNHGVVPGDPGTVSQTGTDSPCLSHADPGRTATDSVGALE